MKKKSVLIYSIFAILLYILSLSYLVFNLIYEYSDGSARTRRRFDHTAITIQENITKIQSDYYNASSVKDQILTSFGNLDDFAFIELTENGKTIYSYKTNTLENSSSKLLINYIKTFKIDNKNYFFTANLYTLRPASIYHYCKISFLIILIVTIITFICIIVTNVSSIKKESLVNTDNDSDENNCENNEKQNTEVIESEKNNQTEITETDNNDKNISTQIAEEKENISEIIASSNEEESLPEEKSESDKEEKCESKENKSKETAFNLENESHNEIPEGVYSSVTGLCFEEFIKAKLENELNKAISSEADLSLFIIKITDLPKENYKYKEICNYLVLQFQYKDMVFEYKNDQIAAIKVNTTIDDAITFADKIHQEIANIVNDKNVNCYIGITSRAVRMVSGERLLIEADEALSHTMDDKDCPITAFRADAEKFRMANL